MIGAVYPPLGVCMAVAGQLYIFTFFVLSVIDASNINQTVLPKILKSFIVRSQTVFAVIISQHF
jgi:hypothetical protein